MDQLDVTRVTHLQDRTSRKRWAAEGLPRENMRWRGRVAHEMAFSEEVLDRPDALVRLHGNRDNTLRVYWPESERK